MPSGQEGMSVLQGAGNWWDARTAGGAQAEAGTQEIHKGVRCRYWSSPLRPPPHPVPCPRSFQVRYSQSHERRSELYSKHLSQIQARLLFSSTLMTQTAVLKILSSFGSSSASGSISAPSRRLHVVTSSLGKWVAAYRQAIRPRHLLRLPAAVQQSPLSSFRAVQ